MENRKTIFGIKKSVVTIGHKIMLMAILHSSFISTSQNMIADYFRSGEVRSYKGSSLAYYEKEENSISQQNKGMYPFAGNYLKHRIANSRNSSPSHTLEQKNYAVSSDIQQGYIGITKENPLDDPSDNLFKCFLSQVPQAGARVYLSYQVYGVQDNNAVARSINERLSTGGYIVNQQKGWSLQKEEINAEWLRAGENRIMFSIPKGANYQYQIKDLKIEVEYSKGNTVVPELIVNKQNVSFVKNNQLYVKGFIRSVDSKDVKVYVEDQQLTYKDGEFEGFLTLTDALKNRKFAVIKAIDSKGLLGQELLAFDSFTEADQLFPIETTSDKVSTQFKANHKGMLEADGASISVKDGALTVDKEISIIKLRNIDIAPMGSGMINVTKGGVGYRFLPDGTKFVKPVSISIQYDDKLLPEGYSPKDIKTFYFNTDSKSWVAVKRDTINEKEKTISALTDHFTDYINGIIKSPESPETAGFTPTMMNDIKAADPSSEMTIISPPEVSQKGDANVSYPIKIPAGRKGMQPQLSLQYSNEGGNGWLGQGWGVNIPSISIDTRWGVPLLDPNIETEIYTLGGDQLMYPKIDNFDWMPNRHYDLPTTNVYNTAPRPRISKAIFTPRKQGTFAKIERLGTSPSTYYWKVTDAGGTISWYGGKTPADVIAGNAVIRNQNKDIVHWGLFMTEDVFGNNVTYQYYNYAYNAGNGSNLNGGLVFNIQNIYYTGHTGDNKSSSYQIEFNKDTAVREDVNINGRLGIRQIDPYFLSNIIIRKAYVRGLYIRKYIFDINYGKFHKGRLLSVAEVEPNETDGSDKEFYRHTFDYYDDISQPGGDVYFSDGVTQTICDTNPVEHCPDKDHDGVCDEVDRCPDVAGPASNYGCPEAQHICNQAFLALPNISLYKYSIDATWYYKYLDTSICKVTSNRISEIIKDGVSYSALNNNIFLVHGAGTNPAISRCPSYPLTLIDDPIVKNPDYNDRLNIFLPQLFNSLGIPISNLSISSTGSAKIGIFNNQTSSYTNSEHIFSFLSPQLMDLNLSYDLGVKLNSNIDWTDHRTKPIIRTTIPLTISTEVYLNNANTPLGSYDFSNASQFSTFQTALAGSSYPGTTATYFPATTQTEAYIYITTTNPALLSVKLVLVNGTSNTYNLTPCGSGRINNSTVSNDWKDIKLSDKQIEYGLNSWEAAGHQLEMPIGDLEIDGIVDLTDNGKDSSITGQYSINQQRDKITWKDNKGSVINDMALIEKLESLYSLDLHKYYNEQNKEYKDREFRNREQTQQKSKAWLEEYNKSIPRIASASKESNAILKTAKGGKIRRTAEANYTNYFARLLDSTTNTFSGGTQIDPSCPPIPNSGFLITGNIPSFDSAAATLGSTSSQNYNIGAHIGIGIDYEWNNLTKNITVGGQYTYGWDDSESLTSMIDINGDGLEDMVIKRSGGIFWKEHVVTRTYDANDNPIVTHSFIDHATAIGSDQSAVQHFYKQNGESSSANFQVDFGGFGLSGFAGIDWSNNHSKNNIYFTDANSDGLIDIVINEVVYFNRIVTIGGVKSPYFEPQSLDTENMLIVAAPKDIKDPDLSNNETVVIPNYDVVKVWEAPANGNIKIENTIINTDVTKEAVVTIEKAITVPEACYSVTFPVPILNFKNFNLNDMYYYTRVSPVQVSLEHRKYIVNGVDYHNLDGQLLFASNGNSGGYRSDCKDFNYLNANFNGSYIEFIRSNDFVFRHATLMTLIGNNFANTTYTFNSYLAYQMAISNDGNCSNIGMQDIVFFEGSLISSSINQLQRNWAWTNNGGSVAVDCIMEDNSYVYGTDNLLFSETTYNLPTVISINGSPISTNSFTLSISSDFNNFVNLIHSIYPGSTVINANNTITITINNTANPLNIITLTPTGNNSPITYNFSEINCDSGKPKHFQYVSRKNEHENEWQAYKCSESEMEFVKMKFIAEGSELLRIKALERKLFKNNNISKDALSYKFSEKFHLYKQNQIDAQNWIDDYYNKRDKEYNTTTEIAGKINRTTCTYESGNICLLYGARLNNGTPSVTNTISTSTTICNPGGGELMVKKGDRIYFRVHSITAGNPAVNWDPKVSYTNAAMLAATDSNNQQPYSSSYSDGFILSEFVPVAFPGNGTASISWNPIIVSSPSDNVTYEIVKRVSNGGSGTTNPTYNNQYVAADNFNPSIDTVIFSQTCAANSASTTVSPATGTLSSTASLVSNAVSVPVFGTLPNQNSTVTQFYFRVRSSSNVDWKAIEWKPIMACNIPNQSITGGGVLNTTETKYPIVDYSIYKPFLCGPNYVTTDVSAYPGGSIMPTLPVFASTDNGSYNFVVKRGNIFLGSRIIRVNGGIATLSPNSSISLGTGTGPIEIGFYTDDTKRTTGPLSTNLSLFTHLANWVTIAQINNSIPVNSSQANFYQKPVQLMGPMLRQWGEFMYNPAAVTGATAIPSLGINLIKEDKLTMSESQATQLQNLLYTSSGSTSPNPAITGLSNISLFNTTGGANNAGGVNAAGVTSVQSQLSTLQSQYNQIGAFPFMAANPSREFDTTTQSFTERWIGMHKECYSSSSAFRAASMSQSFNGFQAGANYVVQAMLETGAYGINKYTKGSGTNISAGGGTAVLGVNASVSIGGSSEVLSEYIDLNGDRYPDLVTNDQIEYTKKTGGLYGAQQRPNPLNTDLSSGSNSSWGLGASGTFSSAGKESAGSDGPTQQQASKGRKFGVYAGKAAMRAGGNSSGAGLSASFSNGASNTHNLWVDINGDGLPDLLNRNGNHVDVALNFGGNSGAYDSGNWGDFDLNNGASTTFGGGIGFNYSSASIEAGVSLGRTDSDIQNSLIDINGDGLLDILNSDSNGISFNINHGNSFSSTAISPFPTSSANHFSYNNSATTTNASVNVSGTFALIWTIVFPFWVLPLKAVDVSLSASAGTATNRSKKSISDFDGDGYPDLLEETGNNTITVYSSRIRRTDMLKSVTNPLGGKFTIDYKAQKLDYNSPNAKWAMSEVKIEDGYNKVNDGEDVYRKEFVYEDGKYDRRERDFYGYKTVKVIDNHLDAQGNSTVYRTSVSTYYNESYFLNGLLRESYVLQGNDPSKKFSKTENTYEVKELDSTNDALANPSVSLPNTFDVGGREGRRSAAVVLTQTRNYLYELAPAPVLTTEVNLTYDPKGRVTVYENKGNTNDPNDDYVSKISYQTSPALTLAHIINVPATIDVYLGNVANGGALIRERSTTVGNFGTILSIKALTGPSSAVTTMKYDLYGNLTDIIYPPNVTGDSMSYHYDYDSLYHKYVIKITDAFGYSSTANYDSRFDKVTDTADKASNVMHYEYDNFSRNTLIQAPKELANTKPYTLKFSYFPFLSLLPSSSGVDAGNFVPVALTQHYDQQHPDNDIETYTFIDGLARPIQVKKDILLNKSGDPHVYQPFEALSVSGSVTYDEFGRTIAQYHPIWEGKTDSQKFLFNNSGSSITPSLTTYDELDRPVHMLDSEGHSSDMEYSIAADDAGVLAVKSKSTVDQGGQNIVTETYKDVSGKVISTMNTLAAGNLWTHFLYNAIGELQSYTDADNLATSYTYDKLGRKLTVKHPDNGLTTFDYDDSGNLLKLQTANLLNDGTLSATDQYIKYKYDRNRLVAINYPNMPNGLNISNVEYKYGSTGNATGRVIWQKDATGTQDFKYGDMGEVVYNERRVTAPYMPDRIFKTSYSYDSWNRLMQLIYPDGEKVDYGYDLGGNLTKMTGVVYGNSYDYLQRIDYDHYEQRKYLLYGNKTETFYNYTPELRRLDNLNVKTPDQHDLYDNHYGYDYVGNVTKLYNNAPETLNHMGGTYGHSFVYDELNRLSSAEGNFAGNPIQQNFNNDFSSTYNVKMEYNNTHGIKAKTQNHSKNGSIFALNTYDNQYGYIAGTHEVEKVINSYNGFTESFKYDLNGNLKYKGDDNGNNRFLFWDESNRLRVVLDANAMQNYIYDASGERVLKANSDVVTPFENGTIIDLNAITLNNYTTYPSAFLVIDPLGIYSKHYYAGSQRIVSRIGELDSGMFNACANCMRPDGDDKTDYKALQQLQISDLQHILEKAKRGKASFKKYKPYKYEDMELAMIEDNKDDGDTKWPDAAAPPISPVYFYHPDHLGSSTFLTDFNGNPYQFFINLPFGETMAEQKPSTYYVTPYKFTGKELDEESGLYYYGARYYDPRISVWYSVDPLMESRMSFSPYNFCSENPINRVDPDGALDDDITTKQNGQIEVIKTNDKFDRFYVEKENGSKKQVAQLDKYKAADRITNLVTFPDQGEGFERYGSKDNGGDHSVQPLVAAALFGAINEITTKDPSITVRLGDMSGVSGNKPGVAHKGGALSHFNGRNVDVGLIRNDNSFSGTNVNNSTFDKNRNQRAVNSYNKFGFKSILSHVNSNGFLLNNTTNDSHGGHFDHIHLQGFNPKIN